MFGWLTEATWNLHKLRSAVGDRQAANLSVGDTVQLVASVGNLRGFAAPLFPPLALFGGQIADRGVTESNVTRFIPGAEGGCLVMGAWSEAGSPPNWRLFLTKFFDAPGPAFHGAALPTVVPDEYGPPASGSIAARVEFGHWDAVIDGTRYADSSIVQAQQMNLMEIFVPKGKVLDVVLQGPTQTTYVYTRVMDCLAGPLAR